MIIGGGKHMMKCLYRIKKICIIVTAISMIFGWIIVTDMVEADAADQKTTSIELSYHTYVLKPKKTVKLKAVCLPKDAKKRTVKWKTSNKSVATVSASGKVTAKKKGTAKIIAVARDGSGRKAVCKIKVTNKITKIKKISLTASAKKAEPGTTVKIKTALKPAKPTLKTLKWESSDPKIASVNQKGVVKTYAEGTVKITAKAQDGSGKKAVCTLKIQKKQNADGQDQNQNTEDTPSPSDTKKPEKILVNKITLSESDISLREGHTKQLTATVFPQNAADKGIVWKSSDNSIACVDANGMVTAVKEGKDVLITAAAQDGSGIYASCRVTVLPHLRTLANDHTDGYYVYRLDRNALQYEQSYTETGKESVVVTDASDVSRNFFKLGMAVRNGIATRQEFYDMILKICNEWEDLSVKEYAEDYSSITLQKTDSKRTIRLTQIDILEKEKKVLDANGYFTKASRIQFCIRDEIFILEVYHNGSTIALFRPNYSNPHFEVYIDNGNYTYVMRMSKLLNGILKDEIGGFPDFKFLNMYNLY